MRVAFDAQTFVRQRTGGISQMFTTLIAAFARDDTLGVEPVPLFRWVNNHRAARELSALGVRGTVSWLPREVLYAPLVLRGLPNVRGAQILHHTYYSRRYLGSTGAGRRVTTVHDMIPELLSGSDGFTASHLAKRDYVMRSDLVICVSESTRQDMLNAYGDVPGRVVVVPNAIHAGFSPDHPRLDGLPAEYLLYVGRRKGYKDFPLLPQAMRHLEHAGLAIPVVVVGPPFTSDEQRTIHDAGVAHLFTCTAMDDGALARAYANARAAVQTSRYEGFGMPPLEALASGVPVVAARASSMPEVCGPLGRYFEAGDADSLAEAIGAVLADDGWRAECAMAGPEWAARFTPQRMAASTAEAYRSVV